MNSSVAPTTQRTHRIARASVPQDRHARSGNVRETGLPIPSKQMDALRTEMEQQDWLDHMMQLMRAAGNDTRVRILYLLWRNGEVRVNDLATILELTTPAISQQLKKLRTCGLVRARRDAQTIYYRLNADSAFNTLLTSCFEDEGL